MRFRPMTAGRRAAVIGLAALLLFAAWSAATLPRPSVRYGDPHRAVSGEGATMAGAEGASAWAGTGGDPGGSQFSALGQIGRGNVAGLKVAWTFHSGDAVPGSMFEGSRSEQIPLVVDDTMYICTPFHRVLAIDAATGTQRWAFDPFAADGANPPLLAGPAKQRHCRGLAFWRDKTAPPGTVCAQRILRNAGDLALIALDARTGRPCPEFGRDTGHAGYVSHNDYDSRGEGPVPSTSPPIVVGDVIVAPVGGRDSLIDAADGIVRGFDARSGKMLWEFDPIPAGREHQTGAANIWTLLSADPARKLVFLATTSPSPDFFGQTRQFDMPLANAVVALSVETGKPAWSYQIVRHDLFDYDLPNHPMLVTIRKDGQLRDVAIQITKHGVVFVLDRDTGQPVFPVQEYRAPASTLKGEKAAAFQPMPRLPEPFAPLTLKADDAFGITPLDRGWCRRRIASLRNDGVFTPPSEQESITVPSAMGGSNWGGAAYDPRTNLLVVRSDNMASTIAIRAVVPGTTPPMTFQSRPIPGSNLTTSGDYLLSPLGIPCSPPPWGTLSAIDMSSGRIVWQVPMGNAHRFGITVPGALHWGSPGVGGPLVTGGGLVFIGAALDGRLRALDVRTGHELWSDALPAPGMSVPVSYTVKGRQYIAITAGGNAFAGTKVSDALVAYTLEK
jgi:quinoprotein glucose dehydrogenase